MGNQLSALLENVDVVIRGIYPTFLRQNQSVQEMKEVGSPFFLQYLKDSQHLVELSVKENDFRGSE